MGASAKSGKGSAGANVSLWCMRCGVEDHCTARCDQSGAPVHLPPGGQDAFGVCLWCGIRGHRYGECLRRVPTEVQELSSKHSETSAITNTNQKEIQELRLETVSVRKGLEEVSSLKTQMAAVEHKVNQIAEWKHTHVAEHAKLKLTLNQHISRYYGHVVDFKDHVKAQRATKNSFEEFLKDTWPKHESSFEDLLARIPPGTETRNRKPASGSSDDPLVLSLSRDDDTDMPASPISGKRRARDSEPPTTPLRNKRSTSAQDKWWLSIRPMKSDQAHDAWHDEILEAVIAKWDSGKWDRLTAWVGEWCGSEMNDTVRSLRSSGTTSRTLKSGLTSVLRGAAMPPTVLGSRAPK